MKSYLFYILIPVLFLISCSTNTRKDEIKKIDPEITLQTVAAFKSAEPVYGEEWKLIFRKLDDCQYILIYTDIQQMKSFNANLILSYGNTYITNPDLVNLRFNIHYTEEAALDPVTGENSFINRLSDISRSRSDRFSEAGFHDDIEADNFIITLKEYVRNDSTKEISELAAYPLVIITGKKKIRINNPESFVKEYNSIFNKKVKNAILNQSPADLKSNAKGVMIGNGELLIKQIDGKIFITSINI